jgi:hypothetical protein
LKERLLVIKNFTCPALSVNLDGILSRIDLADFVRKLLRSAAGTIVISLNSAIKCARLRDDGLILEFILVTLCLLAYPLF